MRVEKYFISGEVLPDLAHAFYKLAGILTPQTTDIHIKGADCNRPSANVIVFFVWLLGSLRIKHHDRVGKRNRALARSLLPYYMF